MLVKVIKKACFKCKRIESHCHFEGRVYFLEDGALEKEFILYEPLNKKYRKLLAIDKSL